MNAMPPPIQPVVTDLQALRLIRLMEGFEQGITAVEANEIYVTMLGIACRTGRELDFKLADFFRAVAHLVEDYDAVKRELL